MLGPYNLMSGRKRSKTPLDILKKALGRDAALLDDIPVNRVEMVVQQERHFERFIRHKVHLEVIWNDSSTCLTLWAYASRDARKDGLFDISFYGLIPHAHRDNAYQSYNTETIITKAHLREEFRCLIHNRAALSAGLKVS
jgi:hypothetical protein